MSLPGRSAFFLLLLLLTLGKLWLALQLPLFGDEAFYWLESRHPAVAHDDVPALVPWLIRLGTALGGPSELALRLPFLLLGLASVALVVRMGAALGGQQAGWTAGCLAMLLPLFALDGLLALPDVPLTLAVLLCAEALRRRLLGLRHGALLLAGGIALGWLSHYRFVVPFGVAGLWLLLHPQGRRLLAAPQLWLSGLLGCAVGTSPLLWHQLAGGGGFAFQFVDRHPWQFQPEALADLLLQALVATPLLFVLLVGTAWRASQDGRRPDRQLVAGLALSILGCYLLLAPFVDTERSRLHWPVPALVLAACVAPAMLEGLTQGGRRLLMATLGMAAAVLGALWLVTLTLAHAPQRLADSEAYLHGFTGWREAANWSKEALADLPPDTVLVADHFALAAQLAFALEGARPVYSLDHPLNGKHGRQGELQRMQLDERGLLASSRGRPMLILLEESASRLRERPAWFRDFCKRFPGARLLFDRSINHGRKRLIAYYQAPHALGGCVPPALGYLDRPESRDRLTGEIHIDGWALRDREGLRAVHARLGGHYLGTLQATELSALRLIFPASDDPRHPDVGISGRFASDLPAGRYWLEIEAEGHDGIRAIVVSMPIDWQPAIPAQGMR